MKLRQEHIETLRTRIAELKSEIDALDKACEGWLGIQVDRAVGGADPYWASLARAKIEDELYKFREQLGDIYDFMSERGMRHIDQSPA